MAESKKRTMVGLGGGEDRGGKRAKKDWRGHHGRGFGQGTNIEPGESGIFVTCPLKKEPKCVQELKDLFEEYEDLIYGTRIAKARVGEEDEDSEVDVEAEISAEIKGMQKPERKPTFTNVHIDVPCVVFIKTRNPIEPVEFVKRICEDAERTGKQKTRFTQRLSPMQVMGNASEQGLQDAATKALRPHFHGETVEQRKFAIRPSIRHSTRLRRDAVIKTVAAVVGPGHKVDLKDFDLLILVEVYKACQIYAMEDLPLLTPRQSVCGISVVGREYEQLKRFNLAEIYEPGAGAVAAAESQKIPISSVASSKDDEVRGAAKIDPSISEEELKS